MYGITIRRLCRSSHRFVSLFDTSVIIHPPAPNIKAKLATFLIYRKFVVFNYFPKGKGVSLSRSIMLDFKYADKDEFVSYAGG